MPELPADTFAAVQHFCEEGDRLAADDRFDDALDQFRQAWDLLPEPREDWSATLWLLGAIGDMHYFRGAFADGRNALTDAMTVFLEAPSNPNLCLRLGQCHYELGDEESAARWLRAAYDQAGDDVFEEEDPKYLAFLQGRPAGPSEPRPSGSGGLPSEGPIE